jgi:hypothetical protein
MIAAIFRDRLIVSFPLLTEIRKPSLTALSTSAFAICSSSDVLLMGASPALCFDHEIDLSAQSGATGNFGVCCNNPLANAVSFSSICFRS